MSRCLQTKFKQRYAPHGKRNVRIALDSNIVMSGMLWGGKPGLLLDLARQGCIEIYTCRELLMELAGAINRPKFYKNLAAARMTPQKLINDYGQLATVIIISTLPMPVSRDPDDDIVLACAVAAQANAIVSGDNDLLAL